MAARKPARLRPTDVALLRLLALAAKGVTPNRMAREVELIVAEWQRAEESDPLATREWLDELCEQIAAGVADAQEQVADADTSEPAAVKQAGITLAALVATHDAANRARATL